MNAAEELLREINSVYCWLHPRYGDLNPEDRYEEQQQLDKQLMRMHDLVRQIEGLSREVKRTLFRCLEFAGVNWRDFECAFAEARAFLLSLDGIELQEPPLHERAVNLLLAMLDEAATADHPKTKQRICEAAATTKEQSRPHWDSLKRYGYYQGSRVGVWLTAEGKNRAEKCLKTLQE